MKTVSTVCGHALLAFAMSGILGACSRDSGSGRIGDASSRELFDRPYVYLIRNDPNFAQRAQNYSFMPPPPKSDSEVVVLSKSEREHVSNPGSDFLEDFTVHLNKQLTLTVIVADSTGAGLIYYEYAKLQPGDYTLATKGWPVPQLEATAGKTAAYIYFVGDKRLRGRYLLGLDTKSRPVYREQKGKPT